ncbi:hypothetical protein C8A01DRAFT_16397 [Parachaetomium inaequale]|uniref:Rhodopsin domain-containing protein n=1 Tax=Parachaetomium inaequale TaxID=2588326 RepID=A0AAN6PET0_9PEZI|nr:hypothetical protein C8A01DRAFT_16397 [Parachaetomium inaequale]
MSLPLNIEEPYPGWAQENRAPLILGVTSAMTALALLFVVGRIYSRLIAFGGLGLGDYIVIICILLSISYIVLTAIAVSYGVGRHVTTVPQEDIRHAMHYTIVSFMPGILSFAIPKFAVIILLAKLLNPGRWHRVIMWIISILYLLLSAGMLVLNIARCQPVAAQWGEAKGTCWALRITINYAIAVGIASALFDFYLAIYPTIVLFQLQLNWKKKLALSSSLGFGYCAGAVAVYKSYTITASPTHYDFTYSVDEIVLWTNIEGNCVLIGACIPCLFPLVKKIFSASALSGSRPKHGKQAHSGPNGTIITIGSRPKDRKRARGSFGLSHLETTTDNSKDIILEERPFHASTAELRLEERIAQQEQQNQHQQEQTRETIHPRWWGR